MFVRIIRNDAAEALVTGSKQLLLLPGEPGAVFLVEGEGELVEVSRVVGERRVRRPPRCGPWRRELDCGTCWR
jgi:hypothetical protein